MRDLIEHVKDLIKSYEGLVEQREALVKSLRRLSQDALNQIDLSETHFSRIDAKSYQFKAEELSRSNYFSAANIAALTPLGTASSVDPILEAEQDEKKSQQVISEEKVEPIVSQELIENDLVSDEELVSESLDDPDGLVADLQVEADLDEEFEEELANMPKVQSEEVDPEESSSLPEDQKKEDNKPASGSFFDQFD